MVRFIKVRNDPDGDLEHDNKRGYRFFVLRSHENKTSRSDTVALEGLSPVITEGRKRMKSCSFR